jgi:hypothetical protein
MILDGRKGWYWFLKSLPKKVREYDVPVRFSIIEREIGSRFNAKSMMVDEGVVAYNIEDADTLLGILFNESLKSKCIVAINASWCLQSAIAITIVLVQGAEGYTNIDANVMDSFANVFIEHNIRES